MRRNKKRPPLRGGEAAAYVGASTRARSAGLLNLARRDGARADPHPLARAVLGHDAGRLQIRKPAAAGLVVGVADVVPGPRPLAANGANCGHKNLLVRARLVSSLLIYG